MQTSESRDEYLRAKMKNGSSLVNCSKVTLVRTKGDFGQGYERVKGRPEVGRVCDDDGQLICEEGEVRKRWRDYFATLLQSIDQPQLGVPRGDAYGAETVEEDDEEITLEEVCNSIAKLKSK